MALRETASYMQCRIGPTLGPSQNGYKGPPNGEL